MSPCLPHIPSVCPPVYLTDPVYVFIRLADVQPKWVNATDRISWTDSSKSTGSYSWIIGATRSSGSIFVKWMGQMTLVCHWKKTVLTNNGWWVWIAGWKAHFWLIQYWLNYVLIRACTHVDVIKEITFQIWQHRPTTICCDNILIVTLWTGLVSHGYKLKTQYWCAPSMDFGWLITY